MSVSIQNRQRRQTVSVARLATVARSALSSLGRRGRDLHVAVVDDREIRRLHRRYMGEGSATDVLAFNLEAPGPSPLLGEVVISAETAARQAARLGIVPALEMDLLLVHGVLHLVGYDDGDPREARRMHARARVILSRMRRRPPPSRLWTGLIDRAACSPTPARSRAKVGAKRRR